MRGKILGLATLGMVGSFFIYILGAGAAPNDIIINEIGAYEPTGYEWIEIWNKGTEPVDIKDWKFYESDGPNHKSFVLKSGVDYLIDQGEYAVICQDDIKFLAKYSNFSGTLLDSAWNGLNEAGKEIGLNDAKGSTIERFTYIPAPNYSLQRKDSNFADYTSNNWQEHISGNTVGAINVFEQTPSDSANDQGGLADQAEEVLSQPVVESVIENVEPVVEYRDIQLNEIVVNPEEGNEWVELYNFGNLAAGLSGWLLCDARNTNSTCKKINGDIAKGEWLKLDLHTTTYLNNDGDSVILKNPSGTVVDQVAYDEEKIGLPAAGQSLVRKENGGWTISETITPGEKNIITEEVIGENNKAIAVTSTVKTISKTKNQIGDKKDEVNIVWKGKIPTQGAPQEKITFDVSASADPRGGNIFYNWDFGDGSNLDGGVVEHVFATSGLFMVKVTATSTVGTVDEKSYKISIGKELTVSNNGVVITEVLPNPNGDDSEEFIELYNKSKQTIDVAGWLLKYDDKDYIFPEKTIIHADSFLIFKRAVTKFSLNNQGGEIELLTPDKNLANKIEYGVAKSGQSHNYFNEQFWVSEPNPRILSVSVEAEFLNDKTSSGVNKEFAGASQTGSSSKTSGQWVRVTGVVSVVPKIFGTQYFYISTMDDAYQVYQYKKDFPELKNGDEISVQGNLGLIGQTKRIKIKSRNDIDVLSTENNLVAVEMTPEEVAQEETILGNLVKINGEITEIKSNYMYVDDGSAEIEVYFKQGAEIDKKKFAEGQLVEVVGIVGENKNEKQVWPRSNEDVVVMGVSDDLLKKQNLNNENKELSKKYLGVVGGGAAMMLLGFLARARAGIIKNTAQKAAIIIGGWFKKK